MFEAVLLHGGFRHMDPELTEFPDDTRDSPPTCGLEETS